MKILNKRFTASINTGNAAFEDYGLDAEVERICKRIEERIEEGETSGKCMDANGNSVGTWKVREHEGRVYGLPEMINEGPVVGTRAFTARAMATLGFMDGDEADRWKDEADYE